MGNQPLTLHVKAGKGHGVRVEIPQSFRGRFAVRIPRPHPVVDFSPRICEHLTVCEGKDHIFKEDTELFISGDADYHDGAQATSRLQGCVISSKTRLDRWNARVQH